jgi:hypothetical protein
MACYSGKNPVTDDERVAIWRWAKANGIDHGLPFDNVHDAINTHFFGGMAPPEWITDILSGRKTPFRVQADAAWKAQYNRRMITQQAKAALRQQTLGPVQKYLGKLWSAPRSFATFGHGVVFPVTQHSSRKRGRRRIASKPRLCRCTKTSAYAGRTGTMMCSSIARLASTRARISAAAGGWSSSYCAIFMESCSTIPVPPCRGLVRLEQLPLDAKSLATCHGCGFDLSKAELKCSGSEVEQGLLVLEQWLARVFDGPAERDGHFIFSATKRII